MRRFLALLLTCVLFVNAAFAGLSRNKSRYVGGTAKDIPVPSVGALDTTDQTHLTFNYEPGKAVNKSKFAAGNFSLPYPEITAIGYGQHATLRVGQTIALAVVAGVGGLLLLLSKSKSHCVTIEYKDAQGNAQSVGRHPSAPEFANAHSCSHAPHPARLTQLIGSKSMNRRSVLFLNIDKKSRLIDHTGPRERRCIHTYLR
jgi:hypothetical protein